MIAARFEQLACSLVFLALACGDGIDAEVAMQDQGQDLAANAAAGEAAEPPGALVSCTDTFIRKSTHTVARIHLLPETLSIRSRKGSICEATPRRVRSIVASILGDVGGNEAAAK